jgi:hypothetical protein
MTESNFISVVAIHGLGSDPAKAWLHRPTAINWLKDLLPRWRKDLRIIAINHDSTWEADAPLKSLHDYGEDILESIASQRNSKEVRRCADSFHIKTEAETSLPLGKRTSAHYSCSQLRRQLGEEGLFAPFCPTDLLTRSPM